MEGPRARPSRGMVGERPAIAVHETVTVSLFLQINDALASQPEKMDWARSDRLRPPVGTSILRSPFAAAMILKSCCSGTGAHRRAVQDTLTRSGLPSRRTPCPGRLRGRGGE